MLPERGKQSYLEPRGRTSQTPDYNKRPRAKPRFCTGVQCRQGSAGLGVGSSDSSLLLGMSLAPEKDYYSIDSCVLLLGNEKSLGTGMSARIFKGLESQRKKCSFDPKKKKKRYYLAIMISIF